MIGLGILFRIIRRVLGKPLEKSGALPTRYYLHQVLRSLDQDDFGEAIRHLRFSEGALVDRSRWELVRQHVLFRCRVLMQKHEKRIRSMENRIRKLNTGKKLPWRWWREKPTDRLLQYQKIMDLERHARSLLENYEKELKHMKPGKIHPVSVSPERSPVIPQP